MFRRVHLSEDVPGTLFLHSMPGRFEPYTDAAAAIAAAKIARVVCLAPMDEIRSKSPAYADALAAGVRWAHSALPVPDYGVPDDPAAYAQLAESVAADLRKGATILIHCAAGIGRTGTFAVAVLLALGVPLDDARARVKQAGSSAETDGQRAFLRMLAERVR